MRARDPTDQDQVAVRRGTFNAFGRIDATVQVIQFDDRKAGIDCLTLYNDIGVRDGYGRKYLSIIVDDDGPGLSPAQRDQVARRGLRLDETKPGSGLGLSIVVELAALYGGNLTLGSSPIGGLRAELALPAG